MNKNELKAMLENVYQGNVSVDDALKLIKQLPYTNLGYAMVDHHRSLTGAHPETVFAKGKTTKQIIGIVNDLLKYNHNIMVTKANYEIYESLKKNCSDLKYHKEAQIIVLKPRKLSKTISKILVLSAGTSDINIAEEVVITAETMGNKVERLYDVGVCGVHRLISNRNKIDDSRVSVIVVVAGMDGALPSVVAGLTDKLIIGVPTSIGYGTNFSGVAPLLTMLNSCSNGVTVVNINNGYGAGYSASIINKIADVNSHNCRK